ACSFTALSVADTYTASLHGALPICYLRRQDWVTRDIGVLVPSPKAKRSLPRFFSIEEMKALLEGEREFAEKTRQAPLGLGTWHRSEEHTSELQSHLNLVCRLLLEKK